MKFATAALVATVTAKTVAVATTPVTTVCPTDDVNSDANKESAKYTPAKWATWIADDTNTKAVSTAEGLLTACYVKEKKIPADKTDTDATLDKVLCLTESNAHTAALNTEFLFKCNVTQATKIRTADAVAKQALAVKNAKADNLNAEPIAAHAAKCATADAKQIAANKLAAKDDAAKWTTFDADAAKVKATKDALTKLDACKKQFATHTDTDADLVKKSGLCVKLFNDWQNAANAEWTEGCIIAEALKIKDAAAKSNAHVKNNAVVVPKVVTAAHAATCPVKPAPVALTTAQKAEEAKLTTAQKQTAATDKKNAAAAKALKAKNAPSTLASTLSAKNDCYTTAKATTDALKTTANKGVCNEKFNAWQAAANESWEVGCDSSDTGMIIGIICGVVGIIVIAGIAYKCHSDKKKAEGGDTFADDLYMSFIDNETA